MSAIQTMMDEHQTILRVLASLEALVSGPEPGDEPVDTHREIVRFLREYADRLHHGKEEDLLFPAMESAGIPADQGPTAVMRIEHDEGRALVRRMAAQCEVEDARFDRRAFAEPALAFVALLRAHIGKEDHILYPLAGRMLRDSDMSQLDQACANADSTHFAADMPATWNAWARDVAGRLGVDREHYDAAPACH